MADPLPVAQTSDGRTLAVLPAMGNRHGLITGATGTGKTVSLQVLAEQFSRIGVPSFLADVKGDLAGLSAAGSLTPKLVGEAERPEDAGAVVGGSAGDVLGCVRPARPSGARNDLRHGSAASLAPAQPERDQSGVLTLVFKIADDNGLLLLDLKDLRSMVQFVGENAKTFTTSYGNVSAASIGAIQRALLNLEQQGGERFFGEPMLDIDDLLQTAPDGRGVVNVLAADQLFEAPKVYASFLLWLLSELFERLTEVGDRDRPRLVFFFDEAHLLFDDAPDALVERIEQVVRLIRSKGVGVYFVTQNPLDIPDRVLGQLGNRIQHALRAFTPRDQKAVRDRRRDAPRQSVVRHRSGDHRAGRR